MEWIENCSVITHDKLTHGKEYKVTLSCGKESVAVFNVYSGGEEVSFISKETMKEVSVVEFLVNKKDK
jgi:hypothetical protein